MHAGPFTLGVVALLSFQAGCSAPDLRDDWYACDPEAIGACPPGYLCRFSSSYSLFMCLVGEAFCGDGRCDPGETTTSCSSDCYCGNGSCARTESSSWCPEDCFCGNGSCDVGEHFSTCSQDCPLSGCGDGVCWIDEDSVTCPSDCGLCGNSYCDPGEVISTCPQDCFCGNGTCDPGETFVSCLQDCDTCGNGTCDAGETTANCHTDCGAYCGDDTCDLGETASNCPQDCGTCGNGICDAGETTASCPQDCTGCVHPTCDLYPQCGCDTGDKCSLDANSARACMAAGSTNAGGLCAVETDCGKGATCRGRSSTQGQCLAYCDASVGCGGGDGSYCIDLLDDSQTPIPGAAVCTIDCIPSTNAGCPTGLGCAVFQDSHTLTIYTDCSSNDGTALAGGACDDTTGVHCAASHFCNANLCYRWCDDTSQCTTGSCDLTAFNPPVVLGTVTYGVCL